MKHLITTLIIVVTMVSGALLQASPGYGEKRFDECRHSDRHMDKGSSRYDGKRIVERMAKKLNLSQEQNTEVRAIANQVRPEIQQIRDKMRKNRKQLQTLMEQDTLDEAALWQLAEQQGSYRAELMILRFKMYSEISRQLNETQRQQLREMRERRRHKRH